MKKLVLLFCLICLYVLSVNAQNFEEVVYLKNGSIIHGTIIEQVPNQSLKIQTRDGNVFVYNMAEVEKFTKEPIKGRSSNYGNQNEYSESKQLNAGTAFAWSLLYAGGGQFYNHQVGKGCVMVGLEALGWVGFFVGLGTYSEYDYSYYNGSYSSNYYDDSDPTLFILSICVLSANALWSMIDAPLSANAINKRNQLSLNYKLNKNINLALKPDYRIDAFNGRYAPVLGAKLSFNIH
jgi:TM2 domain-containing membrane protein YozV